MSAVENAHALIVFLQEHTAIGKSVAGKTVEVLFAEAGKVEQGGNNGINSSNLDRVIFKLARVKYLFFSIDNVVLIDLQNLSIDVIGLFIILK